MSRYIDADKLYKNEIERCGCVPLVGSCSKDNKSLRDVLEEQPTADVVEVVRCEDCKHSDKADYSASVCCNFFPKIVNLDDYCSYGERREG